MKNIANFFNRIRYKTLIKYFFSYFLVISAILFGFFTLFRHQLQETYYEAQDRNIQEKMDILQENLIDCFDTFFQVHYNLENNRNLTLFRHSGSMWYKHLSIEDMREFTGSNPYISDIVYIDHKNNTILAGKNYVLEKDGEYILQDKKTDLVLPVEEYGHRNFNSVVYLENDGVSKLLSFPSVINQNYELVYNMDEKEIFRQAEGLLMDGDMAMCLVDSENKLIDGNPPESLNEYIEQIDISDGFQKHETDGNVIYSVPMYSNLYLAVMYSKNIFSAYANKAFFNLYIITAVIGSIGLLLICFAMKITYVPLYKLTKKYTDDNVENESFVKQLDKVFSTTLEQKQEMQKKIERYHDMMQESILDAISHDRGTLVEQEDIDRLFNMEQGSMLFVITISVGEKGLAEGEIPRYITASLPEKSSCILLDQNEKTESYLIYYCGQDQDKDRVIRFLIKEFYENYGYKISLSNGGFSPLHIPSLYEQAIMARDYWEESEVSIYDEVMKNKINYDVYPYEKLDELSDALQKRNFEMAKVQLHELRTLIDESGFPPFYIHSVLIDIITMIVMTMNRLNIKFKSYGDVYFETLYYSRSCEYKEKSQEIWSGIRKMVEIFQEQITNATIYADQIQEIIESEYMLPEFSIASLADRFHVSIAYMSYLFKKYYDLTFSEYLWNLRLAKAKELLTNTDEPIDTICNAVGYENASSFRRKFKKELDITPSQFREQNKKK